MVGRESLRGRPIGENTAVTTDKGGVDLDKYIVLSLAESFHSIHSFIHSFINLLHLFPLIALELSNPYIKYPSPPFIHPPSNAKI
jgi:hypothetical protein